MNWPKVKLPLRYLLIIPFLLQICIVVVIVGWLSFQSGQQAVDDLANQLINKSERLVQQHLDSFLSVPHEINALSESAIATGILNPNDYSAAGQFYWKQATLHQDISWAGYALPSGELVGAGEWITDQGITIAELSQRTDQKLYNYSADGQGNRIKRVQVDDYTPLSDAWFLNTQTAGKPMWTPVYAASGLDNYITISATRPVYSQNQTLQGILVVDLLLSNISSFLDSLDISPTAQIFITDREGRLIGSTATEQYAVVTNNGESHRLKAIESQNPLVHATAQFLQQTDSNHVNNLLNNVGEKSLSFQWSGEKQFLSILPWKDDYGLDWRVITVVPESDFMAQIKANTTHTILLSLMALFIATILGIMTAQWIAQPISRLSQASKELVGATRNLTLKPTAQVQDNNIQVQELQALAQTFDQMASDLQQAFTELATINEELEQRVDQRTFELQDTLAQLRLTQAQLTHQEKTAALSRVAAGIAHEMNNSMNFIYGNLKHLSEYHQDLLELIGLYQEQYPMTNPVVDDLTEDIDFDFLKTDIIKTVDSMNVGVERVRDIVISLQTFSYADQSGKKLADIHEQLDSTLAMFQNHWRTEENPSGIQLIQNYDQLPKVSCYPGDLNQVLFNIITNAIEVLNSEPQSSQGTSDWIPLVQIDTLHLKSNRIMITIANNGPKIPTEIQSRLFDPFFTTKDVGQGMGMGLALSYQIVTQQHKGSLTCGFTPDEMTYFRIEIPV